MFSQIRQVAENEVTTPPVRFLSRYDKSATNIKDSLLWVSIGQVCLSVVLNFHCHIHL